MEEPVLKKRELSCRRSPSFCHSVDYTAGTVDRLAQVGIVYRCSQPTPTRPVSSPFQECRPVKHGTPLGRMTTETPERQQDKLLLASSKA